MKELWLDRVRRLQLEAEPMATANDTRSNETVMSLYSPCELEVMQIVDLEQCEIDYRINDCPEAKSKNWVAWTDLAGGVYFLHIYGVLVMFMSLSVVCDEFFVPGTHAPQASA